MTLSAQQDNTKQKTPFKDRLVYGGNVVASFSNQQTAVGLSPRIGYRASDRYIPGIGLSYIYFSYPDQTFSIASGSFFNRFYPIEQGFIEAEFEYGRLTGKTKGIGPEQKFTANYPALLVGAGVRQGGGRESLGVSFGVFYDVLQDPNSPYGREPVFRGGVFFGL